MASVAEDFPGRPCEVEIQESPHEVVNDERILVRPAFQIFNCFSGCWRIATRLRPFQHMEHDGAPRRQVVANHRLPLLTATLAIELILGVVRVLCLEGAVTIAE